MTSFQTPFKRNIMSASVIAAVSMGAQAQTTQPNEIILEDVIVTGIRASLTGAMDIKRDATGVVDAISAEDIGKFPDTNLAESLQRITGVAIDRSNNEGNQVTVRGFGPSFNLVMLNGRQMPNSSALSSTAVSRSFNFREIAAESVSRVEVYKTGKAHMPSGGLGATINLQTAKPFDFDGFTLLGSTKGIIESNASGGNNVTPEVSGMVSQIFGDDSFGILASFSHAQRDFHVDRIGTANGWSQSYPAQSNPDTSAINTNLNPSLTTWRVATVDLDNADYERTRQNGQIVLQYFPDDDFSASVDYTMSRFEENGQMNRMSFWFDDVETGKADANGTIINPARSNDELNFWAWEYGFTTENDSFGLNIDWAATETIKLVLDAHSSKSHSNPGAQPAERIANLKNPFGDAAPVHISADFSGKLPTVAYDDSALVGGAYARENIEADLYQERGNEVENTVDQIQFSGEWVNPNESVLRQINFGFASITNSVDTLSIHSSNFSLGNGAVDISDLDLTFSPGDIGYEFVPNYSANQFLNLVEEQGFKNPTTLDENGIEESISALYLSLDFETDIRDMLLRTNIGVRYETTTVNTYSKGKPVIGFNWVSPLELAKIVADEAVTRTADADYNHVLPNLDISLDIVEDVIARLSYSTTIARSNIDAMYPNVTYYSHQPNGPFTASQGNAALLPFDSANLDFSLEWYYADGSYISGGYFSKNVDNFLAAGQELQTIIGPEGPLTNPSANPRPGCPAGSVSEPVEACTSQPSDPEIIWGIATPKNTDESLVDGWELNVQHMFGQSGFGAILNYTTVNSDDHYDVYAIENGLALQGLSDTANLVAFYEKNGLQLRVAYNWRDKFLLASGPEPTFTAAYSQVDLNASYDINENLTVFIEGLNLTDEATHRYGRWENQLKDYEQYGQRYALGIRAKL
ncbi:TonB-dependent receptor [Saccharophagus degradans]|uniref:TonB-dependent receptor n=1 Tax=Saccharophagus degradans TaxID=86304 RepID=UPI0024781570|nr:TonB-dependent receptor [Saccharophagus degradans]WGO97281.1 TonB-dependent receptor [Saccharophagus degradans]